MNKPRKSFQHLPGHENPHFITDGREIYQKLREKYPNTSVEDLDSILNILCSALIHLIEKNINQDNYPYVIQAVHKILTESLK